MQWRWGAPDAATSWRPGGIFPANTDSKLYPIPASTICCSFRSFSSSGICVAPSNPLTFARLLIFEMLVSFCRSKLDGGWWVVTADGGGSDWACGSCWECG